VVFDFLAQKTKKRGLLEAAYYNLPGAAIFALPAVVTGILARQLQLEGQKKTQRHFAYVCGAGFDVDDPHLGGLGTARVYQTTLAKRVAGLSSGAGNSGPADRWADRASWRVSQRCKRPQLVLFGLIPEPFAVRNIL
jgi:hypothetical protein